MVHILGCKTLPGLFLINPHLNEYNKQIEVGKGY